MPGRQNSLWSAKENSTDQSSSMLGSTKPYRNLLWGLQEWPVKGWHISGSAEELQQSLLGKSLPNWGPDQLQGIPALKATSTRAGRPAQWYSQECWTPSTSRLFQAKSSSKAHPGAYRGEEETAQSHAAILALGCLRYITARHSCTYAPKRLSPSPTQRKHGEGEEGDDSLDDEIP